MTVLTMPPTAPPVGPRPARFTVAEFHRLGDLGALAGRRAMLIDGLILDQGPMNPPHAVALVFCAEAIRIAFGAGWHVRNQSPLVLGLSLDPEPDLAVVPGRPSVAAGHPATADLVFEVSDTSLAFDTGEKRLLYAAAGIRDYWVLDLNGRRLVVYRDPQQGDYAAQQVFGPTESVAPLGAPAAAVMVADLLP